MTPPDLEVSVGGVFVSVGWGETGLCCFGEASVVVRGTRSGIAMALRFRWDVVVSVGWGKIVLSWFGRGRGTGGVARMKWAPCIGGDT